MEAQQHWGLPNQIHFNNLSRSHWRLEWSILASDLSRRIGAIYRNSFLQTKNLLFGLTLMMPYHFRNIYTDSIGDLQTAPKHNVQVQSVGNKQIGPRWLCRSRSNHQSTQCAREWRSVVNLTILVLIISHGFLYPLVHGSHLLTLTYERFQWSPWILSLGVLVGSVGFTILVLAFFLLQNQRMCSRSE